MRIELESNDFDEKCSCQLCGRIFIPRDVVARAYNDSGEYITDVCHECIASGEEGMSRRIRERADRFRQMAFELERLASGRIETPSLAQFNVMDQIVRTLQ